MNRPQTVAIIGAGTMGHALAVVHAIGGCSVRLTDNSADQLARAEGLIASAFETLVDGETLTPADRRAAIDRITRHATLAETVEGADLIVEAVVEDPDVKRVVYGELDQHAKDDAVIVSNTSYLDVFPLIPERRQSQTAITHWYTPPYIVDLVDLAPGPQTNSAIVPALEAFYRDMGKKPVVFETLVPGYIANRLQAAMALEIYKLIDEGLVTPQMVDDSIKYGLSLRMVLLGHVMKTDYTGLPMAQRALSVGGYVPPKPQGHSKTLDKLIADGRTGVMSGAGYYDYGGKSAEDLFRARDLNLLRLRKLQLQIDEEETGP